MEAGVRVTGRSEAGEHPHRPEAGPVHLGVHAPGVGELARERTIAVDAVHRDTGEGSETGAGVGS